MAANGTSVARTDLLRRAWPWLPVGIAGVYLVVLLATLKDVVQSIYLSADIASGPVIAELSDNAPAGSEVVLGNFPWYEPYWFETLTRWAPAHRQLWELAPYVCSLAGIACLAWSASKAAGQWAGAMVAVALGCASGALLTYQFAWSVHAAVLFHVPLLGAFLVLCASRGGLLRSRPVHVAAAAGLTLFTAVGVASDKLLVVAGVLPLAIAGLALAWLLRGSVGRLLGITACGVAVGSVVLSVPIGAAARDAGISAADFPIHFATFDRLGPNFRLLFESLAFLAGGDFGGEDPSASTVLELLCAATVAAGAVWAVRYARRFAADPPTDAVRAAHLVFWAAAGTLTALTFLLSSLPIDKYTSRYVIVTLYAIPALLAVGAAHWQGWRRAVVVVGVALAALSGVASLIRDDVGENPTGWPTGAVSGPLGRLVAEENLDHGYAGYWDAAPLTWQTKAQARVYPVEPCTAASPDKAGLCPFPFHRIDSWYRPKPGARTFLVIDPTQPGVQAPDPRFGRPQRTERIGQLEVRVYGYDIASRLGP
jgi:hypothetical protein